MLSHGGVLAGAEQVKQKAARLLANFAKLYGQNHDSCRPEKIAEKIVVETGVLKK
ncbi:MAG TPA: hypothetical protein VKA81_09300 [Verrucomicrobiae bacterium]|nr:hypothetical protein [Verrucomicrobiae bacterium]